MEKTAAAATLPFSVGWNDVDSRTSLWEIPPRDANGDFANGGALLEESTGCYIYSEHRLASTIGVHDLINAGGPKRATFRSTNHWSSLRSQTKLEFAGSKEYSPSAFPLWLNDP